MKSTRQFTLLLLAILLTGLLVNAKAQTWLWARQSYDSTNTTQDDEGLAISCDKYGSAYSVGIVHDEQLLGDTLTGNVGESEFYLWKYHRSGFHVWALGFGTPGQQEGSAQVKATPQGGSYVSGFSKGGMVCRQFTNQASGLEDIFVLKVDTNGNPAWLQKAGGSGQDLCLDLALDKNENCYLTGYFQDSAFFGNDTLLADTHALDQTTFLARLDSSGNWVWAKKIHAFGPAAWSRGTAVEVDQMGFVYLAGVFHDSIQVDTFLLGDTAGGPHFFIAKFDTSGNAVWAKQWLNRLERNNMTPDIRMADICSDSIGQLYLTGTFMDTLLVDGFSIASPYGEGSFVAEMSPEGDLGWFTQGSEFDVRDVEIFPRRILMVAGNFKDSISIGGAWSYADHPSTSEAYLGMMDTYGFLLKTFHYGGPHDDRVNGMAYSPGHKPHMIVTGMIEDTVAFSYDTLMATPGWPGWAESYLARLRIPCGGCLGSNSGGSGGSGGNGGNEWDGCIGDTIVVQADSGYIGYLWSTGDTTQTIYVTASQPMLWYTAWDSTDTIYSTIETISLTPRPTVTFEAEDHCEGNPAFFEALLSNPYGYSLNWDFGDGEEAEGNPQVHLYTNPGTFTVTVIASGNSACQDTFAQTLQVFEIPDLPVWPSDTFVCDSTGFVISAPGGWQSYLWQDSSTSNSFHVPASGAYWVQLTHPCATGYASMQVLLSPNPDPGPIAGLDQVICLGDSIRVGVGGIPAGWEYEWLQAPGLDSLEMLNPFVSPTQSQSYVIMASDTSIGCVNSSSDTVFVKVEIPNFPPYPPQLQYSFCPGEVLTVGVEPFAGFSYQWDPTEGLKDHTASMTDIAPMVPALYELLIVNDTMQSERCRVLTLPVDLYSQGCIVQTIVTPNGDGINDFLLLGSHATPVSLSIFDRWGHQVFHSDAYQGNWPLAGSTLPETVYWYVVKQQDAANFSGNSPSQYVGEILLVR